MSFSFLMNKIKGWVRSCNERVYGRHAICINDGSVWVGFGDCKVHGTLGMTRLIFCDLEKKKKPVVFEGGEHEMEELLCCGNMENLKASHIWSLSLIKSLAGLMWFKGP